MKNLKVSAAVLALLFVVFSAFKSKKSAVVANWYQYQGSDFTIEELRKSDNYVYYHSSVPPCYYWADEICGIRYEGTVFGISSDLDFDYDFQSRLEWVIMGGTDEDIATMPIE
jgi:hypothetical protein